MEQKIPNNQEQNTLLEISDSVIQKWQTIVNTSAKVLDVPAGLVMRINEPDLEVFVSGHTDGKPLPSR